MNSYFFSLFHWNPFEYWWIILFAIVFDWLFADPRSLVHPVQCIGWFLDFCEPRARASSHHIFAGAVVTCVSCVLFGGIVAVCVNLPSFVGVFFSLYFAWAGLALGGLLRFSQTALVALKKAHNEAQFGTPDSTEMALQNARDSVSALVSRDVRTMGIDDLSRSLAETMSENVNDAFVAPLFWLILTGPVGLWVYKTISTIDSMWGYRSERWLYLGRIGARLDDVLAYFPARITAVCLWLAAVMLGTSDRWPGWKCIMLNAQSMASPNAGWPMTVAAWICGGQMGGPTVYDGTLVIKPYLGPPHGRWSYGSLLMLIEHIRIAAIVSVLFLFFLAYFLSVFV